MTLPLVVGVDGSEASLEAVDWAADEAAPWSTPPGTCTVAQAASLPLEAHRRPPAQVLDDALRDPPEQFRDAVVERQLVEKPARQALLEAASTADLLVVGARRRRGRPGLHLGVVSHALLHHAPCPIAVVSQM